MKKLRYIAYLIIIITVTALRGWSQNMQLRGVVVDVSSKKPISEVNIFSLVEKTRAKLGTSDERGTFSINYAQKANALLLEKDGFRALNLVVRPRKPEESMAAFFIMLPMIPLDKQASDKPYMQSEQTDFVLETTKASRKKLTRHFIIKDAVTLKAIESASVCFEHTRIEKKQCKDINAIHTLTMIFEEPDIINMVVESPGYQTYRGNLILEKMDDSDQNYEIKMTPEVTMLAVRVQNIKSIINCVLRQGADSSFTMNQGEKGLYYALAKPGKYVLQISNGAGGMLHNENLTIEKGLNFLEVVLSGKPAASIAPKMTMQVTSPVTSSITPLADTVRNVTLYFEQSTHTLLPESTQKLDQLIQWLKESQFRQIRIVGHSDNVGDPRKNDVLSEYRARVTYNYLLEKGGSPSQMQWTALGGNRPAEKNDTEENKKKNRRVEITLIPAR